jgi:hypothetical protein
MIMLEAMLEISRMIESFAKETIKIEKYKQKWVEQLEYTLEDQHNRRDKLADLKATIIEDMKGSPSTLLWLEVETDSRIEELIKIRDGLLTTMQAYMAKEKTTWDHINEYTRKDQED